MQTSYQKSIHPPWHTDWHLWKARSSQAPGEKHDPIKVKSRACRHAQPGAQVAKYSKENGNCNWRKHGKIRMTTQHMDMIHSKAFLFQ